MPSFLQPTYPQLPPKIAAILPKVATVIPLAASLVFAGQSVSVSHHRQVAPTQASAVFSPQSVSVTKIHQVTPTQASLLFTGQGVTLLHHRLTTPTQASALFAGQSVSVLHHRLVSVGAYKTAGTGSSNSLFGGEVWLDPTNISSADELVSASIDFGAGVSERLEATSFGFAVPTNATILGIKVSVEKRKSGSVTDNNVQLIKAGVTGGTNNASAAAWSTTEAVTEYGGSSDLWGRTWTAADINNSNFGVSFAANLGGGVAYVDHISITVYFATGAKFTGQSVTISHHRQVSPVQANALFSGQTVSVSHHRQITANQANAVFSPQSVGVNHHRLVTPTNASALFTGQSVTVTHEGGGVFTVTPLQANLVFSPQNVQVNHDRLITPTSAAATFSPQTVTVTHNRQVTPSQVNVVFSGQNVVVAHNREVTPVQKNLLFTGQSVNVAHNHFVTAVQANALFTGAVVEVTNSGDMQLGTCIVRNYALVKATVSDFKPATVSNKTISSVSVGSRILVEIKDYKESTVRVHDDDE